MSDTIHKQLLITGCGRSGTKYTALLLKELGLDVPHECMGRDGAVGWMYVAAEQYGVGTDVDHGSREGIVFGQIFHQVRHPLDTIASLQTHGEDLWDFCGRHVPLMKKNPERLMAYWLDWNARAAAMADWTYRVEELRPGTAVAREFLDRIGLPDRDLPDLPHNVNHRRHADLTWAELDAKNSILARWIRKAARRYGYDV